MSRLRFCREIRKERHRERGIVTSLSPKTLPYFPLSSSPRPPRPPVDAAGGGSDESSVGDVSHRGTKATKGTFMVRHRRVRIKRSTQTNGRKYRQVSVTK